MLVSYSIYFDSFLVHLNRSMKANEQMQKQMEQMQSSIAKASSSKATFTPPPRVAAPSPADRPKAPQEPGKPPQLPPGVRAPGALEFRPAPPGTEGAKLARLRRLCERKPSGKLAVPESVHLRWKQADKAERECMIEEFEKAHWSKDS